MISCKSESFISSHQSVKITTVPASVSQEKNDTIPEKTSKKLVPVLLTLFSLIPKNIVLNIFKSFVKGSNSTASPAKTISPYE